MAAVLKISEHALSSKCDREIRLLSPLLNIPEYHSEILGHLNGGKEYYETHQAHFHEP